MKRKKRDFLAGSKPKGRKKIREQYRDHWWFHKLNSMNLDPQEVKWIGKRLDKLISEGDCEYVDNIRIARVGDEAQEKKYRKQQEDGCCGFVDVTETMPKTGARFHIGFNYGH